jgi:hypothetical protein
VTDPVHDHVGGGAHSRGLHYGLEAVAEPDSPRIDGNRANRQQVVALRIEAGSLGIEHDPTLVVAIAVRTVVTEPAPQAIREAHA